MPSTRTASFRISRRAFLATGTSALLPLAPLRAAADESPPPPRRELWFRQPAVEWLAALPVGNGRIGAMMFGGVEQERIQLSESTLWSGGPSDRNLNPEARANLPIIRKLLIDGRYDEADRLVERHLLGREDQFGTQLPLGSLMVRLEGEDGARSHYRRWLDLGTGISGVSYWIGGATFRRELFVSNPDDVLVLRLETDRPGGLSAVIGFADDRLPGTMAPLATDGISLTGQALEKVHSDGTRGVRFRCGVRAAVEGGRVHQDGDTLRIENATCATIVLAIATDYVSDTFDTRCETALTKAMRRGHAALRAAHVADHGALFQRAALSLEMPAGVSGLPTDERRALLKAGRRDPDLQALFFDYGRYLTIAGSRSNSPLPMALQGIWNDGRAAAMGWSDDYHLDINTQQNYWACEVANLSECHTPLWSYLQMLARSGSATAREMYGCEGWVAHVVSNAWGFTAPGWGNGWGLFPTGGLWLALDVWDHYRFRPDAVFLRKTAWPIVRDAAVFFLDYMTVHPRHGWLVTGPSISPENAFVSPETGKPVANSLGPTCDMVLIHTLFSACIAAADTLGGEDTLKARLVAAQKQLPPLQVGRHGQLQEWLDDFGEAQPSHRHTSHLLALYPYTMIDVRKDAGLAAAARTTIQRRISQPDWEDTEWGRANFAGYHARLLDGDAAERQIHALMTHNAGTALLTFSPGGVAGAQQDIFSLDGNTGGAATIAEMLLQSHDDAITVLPALPSIWGTGQFRGLRARGGVTVSIAWQEGRPVTIQLLAESTQTRTVRFENRSIRITLPAGRTIALGSAELSMLAGAHAT